MMKSFEVRAPTRADLAGGTLDIWPIYNVLHRCRTINVALDLFENVKFSVTPNTSFHLDVQALNKTFSQEKILEPGEILKKASKEVVFPAYVVNRFLSYLGDPIDAKVSITISTEVPPGSGLGGSSSLSVALLKGVGAITGHFQDEGWEWEILSYVKDIEAEFLRVPTGTQDYLAALFGGFASYSFSIGQPEHVSYSRSLSEEISARLVILNSGEIHKSGLSNWSVYRKLFDGDKSYRTAFQELSVISEALHSELSKKKVSWTEVGKTLNEEWNTRRRVFEIHTSRLDELIEFSRSNGAIGTKVCGAASGGCLVALVEPEKRTDFVKRCEKQGIGVLPTKLSPKGVHVVST